MGAQDSVSQWIVGLKEGERQAIQQLWDRYAARLTALADRRLKDVPRRAYDEEDVAQSVFRSICRGAAAGRFGDVKDRDDLWWLLLAITKQKVVNYIRKETSQKRGGGRVRAETDLRADGVGGAAFDLEGILGDEPTPEFAAMLDEQNERLLSLLRDDQLRSVALARMEGYTVLEIADDLGVCMRTVERKLRLIRNTWAGVLDDAE